MFRIPVQTGRVGELEGSRGRLPLEAVQDTLVIGELSLDGIGFIPTIVIWGQTGYNSSLVDYYRKVDSWGIAAVFRDTY